MSWSREQIRKIYDKTGGYCHLCGKKLSIKNYGKSGSRGAWNVDHSKAQAVGGKHHMNNLYPACICCNSRKGTRTSRSVRNDNGLSAIPGKKQNNDTWIIGGILLLLFLTANQKSLSDNQYRIMR